MPSCPAHTAPSAPELHHGELAGRGGQPAGEVVRAGRLVVQQRVRLVEVGQHARPPRAPSPGTPARRRGAAGRPTPRRRWWSVRARPPPAARAGRPAGSAGRAAGSRTGAGARRRRPRPGQRPHRNGCSARFAPRSLRNERSPSLTSTMMLPVGGVRRCAGRVAAHAGRPQLGQPVVAGDVGARPTATSSARTPSWANQAAVFAADPPPVTRDPGGGVGADRHRTTVDGQDVGDDVADDEHAWRPRHGTVAVGLVIAA